MSALSDDLYRTILQAIQNIRFGSVEIVIQDGRVVQIERREKVRFDKEGQRKPD